MEQKESLVLAVQQQIKKAKEYIDRAGVLEDKGIDGANKLTKKLRAELRFLNGLSQGHSPIKPCHINSSNLSHLGAVLDVAETKDIVAFFKSVTWCKPDGLDTPHALVVDLVTSCSWIKVVARNAIALHRSWEGEGNFGDKSIDKQAEEYISASQQNQVNFTAPKVSFLFTQGITEKLAEHLLNSGINVRGNILPNPGAVSLSNVNMTCDLMTDKPSSSLECHKINLDVTAMISLVSALTNGSCHFKFQEQVLTDQAEREQMNPLLPKLNKFLEGKKLYACTLAISSFQAILETLGGTSEKQRAKDLLSRVTEVSNNPSTRAERLTPSARIKPRPKIVFGTGDTLQAVTVSSNRSFVRAAKEQGVEFSVYVHEPRALTESKEPFATVVKDEQ